jgi:hypothetical protein
MVVQVDGLTARFEARTPDGHILEDTELISEKAPRAQPH